MEKGKIIIWTIPAKHDLKDIFDFISEFSYPVADKIIDKIIEKVGTLQIEGFENSGQIDSINSNYRRLIEGNYKILYKIKNEKIIIYGIFDSRQHPDKLKNK